MNKSTRKLQCAAKAASLALNVAVTRERNRPAKDATAEAVRHAVRGSHYLARDNKGRYVISQIAADALNEVIDKGKLTDRDQITLWRVHEATKVSKDGEIVSPKGYAAQLCGFVWGGTHYGAKLQYKAQHNGTPTKKEPKPILAGDPRSVACPKCNAAAGSICVRDNGKPQHNTHAARKTGAAGMPVVADKASTTRNGKAGKAKQGGQYNGKWYMTDAQLATAKAKHLVEHQEEQATFWKNKQVVKAGKSATTKRRLIRRKR